MKTVTVALATFNGAEFLPQQLASLATQSGVKIRLRVRDDGSSDRTLAILHDFRDQNPQIDLNIQQGQHVGFAQNFLQLLRECPMDTDYFAFCDQDDVWLPQKLLRAIHQLDEKSPQPALYCGAKLICDRNLNVLATRPPPARASNFCCSLHQNIASGNTIVLNTGALTILKSAAFFADDVAFHDWWVLQVMSALDHPIICDQSPTILYRQHAENAVGAGHGWRPLLQRSVEVITGRQKQKHQQQLSALYPLMQHMPQNNRDILKKWQFLQNARPTKRLRFAWHNRLRRDSYMGTASLYLAIAMGRV